MELRDYRAWHEAYDDPGSSMSWRLSRVREFIERALDAREGPVRVLSVCAGDGRDLLGVLEQRTDASRVSAVLLEIDPVLAASARERAAGSGAAVEVRALDAGLEASYVDAVPADIVLLVGIFGNIADADIRCTISAARGMCTPGAHVIWTRGEIDGRDLAPTVATWFEESGFESVDLVTHAEGSRPSVGFARYAGVTAALPPDSIFAFIR